MTFGPEIRPQMTPFKSAWTSSSSFEHFDMFIFYKNPQKNILKIKKKMKIYFFDIPYPTSASKFWFFENDFLSLVWKCQKNS